MKANQEVVRTTYTYVPPHKIPPAPLKRPLREACSRTGQQQYKSGLRPAVPPPSCWSGTLAEEAAAKRPAGMAGQRDACLEREDSSKQDHKAKRYSESRLPTPAQS